MALEGGEGSASHPGRSLPPGKTRYPLYRRLGGPQGRSGHVRKISPPPWFHPRTVQPVAIRYTDWATRSTKGKAPKEIHAILTETLACFLPSRAKDLSAPLYASSNTNLKFKTIRYISVDRRANCLTADSSIPTKGKDVYLITPGPALVDTQYFLAESTLTSAWTSSLVPIKCGRYVYRPTGFITAEFVSTNPATALFSGTVHIG